MKNISLCMHTWCKLRNFASMKFRLTPDSASRSNRILQIRTNRIRIGLDFEVNSTGLDRDIQTALITVV